MASLVRQGVIVMISFEYRLVGSGWSEATLADGSNETILTNVSYLSDALRDLVATLIELMEGAKRAEFTWYDEPGEYQWLLTNHKQLLSIRITRYQNWEQDRKPREHGKTIFKARCALREFAVAVLAQLREIDATLGPEGYKARWVAHSFPSKEYQRLTSLLDG